MNLLIVEDDEGVSHAFHRVLSKHQLDITRVPNWKGMEEALNEKKFDVILLDLGLPDSDTQTTLSKIRSIKMNHPATAVCIITGHPSQNSQKAEEAGADAFLYKPEVFQKNRLFETVSILFSRYSTKPEAEKAKHQIKLLNDAVPATIEEMKKID